MAKNGSCIRTKKYKVKTIQKKKTQYHSSATQIRTTGMPSKQPSSKRYTKPKTTRKVIAIKESPVIVNHPLIGSSKVFDTYSEACKFILEVAEEEANKELHPQFIKRACEIADELEQCILDLED